MHEHMDVAQAGCTVTSYICWSRTFSVHTLKERLKCSRFRGSGSFLTPKGESSTEYDLPHFPPSLSSLSSAPEVVLQAWVTDGRENSLFNESTCWPALCCTEWGLCYKFPLSLTPVQPVLIVQVISEYLKTQAACIIQLESEGRVLNTVQRNHSRDFGGFKRALAMFALRLNKWIIVKL